MRYRGTSSAVRPSIVQGERPWRHPMTLTSDAPELLVCGRNLMPSAQPGVGEQPVGAIPLQDLQ